MEAKNCILLLIFTFSLPLISAQDGTVCNPSCGPNGVCIGKKCQCKPPFTGASCDIRETETAKVSYLQFGALGALILLLGAALVGGIVAIVQCCKGSNEQKYMPILDPSEVVQKDEYREVKFPKESEDESRDQTEDQIEDNAELEQ